MCNLYRMTKTPSEVAQWFGVEAGGSGFNFGTEVYPGYPALVIAGGKVAQMHWGFPLKTKPKSGRSAKPKPVNNTRSDKLDSFFWRESFAQRRCLIPLTAWAEAQGPRGSKTRTWLWPKDAELFACAGIWRASDEWGECFSMVMTDAAGEAAQVHTRMPVILARRDFSVWTGDDRGAARALCRPFDGAITIERTAEPWVHRAPRNSA